MDCRGSLVFHVVAGTYVPALVECGNQVGIIDFFCLLDGFVAVGIVVVFFDPLASNFFFHLCLSLLPRFFGARCNSFVLALSDIRCL